MDKRLPPLSLFIILLALSIGYSAMIHYSTDGFVEVDTITLEEYIVTIGYGCRGIVADTSPERALSIQQGLRGVIEDRPMSHDTFVEVLKSFNITVEALKINKFEDERYYADLILSNEDKVLTIDLLPSDGIALCTRTNATIYINQTLLNEYGEDIC